MKLNAEKDIIFVGYYKHLPIFMDTEENFYYLNEDERDTPFPAICDVKLDLIPVEELPEKDQEEIYIMYHN